MSDYFVEEPMLISDLELAELKSRAANAIRTKSLLANVDGHIQTIKERLGSEVRAIGDSESKIDYLYSLIVLAEVMPAASEPDAVRVVHRDRFIKDAASKGKFTMNVAHTGEDLAEQLSEDLRNERASEEPPPVIEVTEETPADDEEPKETKHKGKKEKKS
jgi:hypothetical protein